MPSKIPAIYFIKIEALVHKCRAKNTEKQGTCLALRERWMYGLYSH